MGPWRVWSCSYLLLGCTPRGVRNAPLLRNQDPSYMPPRAIFLPQNLVSLVSCYLVLDLLGLSADPEKNKMFFAPSAIPLFTQHGEVSQEELAMRLLATLASGLGVTYARLGVYRFVALVAIGMKSSAPRCWRPLFGSISQADTVHCFWRFGFRRSSGLFIPVCSIALGNFHARPYC